MPDPSHRAFEQGQLQTQIGAGGGVHGSGAEMTRIERQFHDFHLKNLHVYFRLVELARDLKHRGHKKIGIGMLFEVLRWEHLMQTDDPASNFKLNNNYRAHYARKIMDNNPDLADFFETRTLREVRSRQTPTGRI